MTDMLDESLGSMQDENDRLRLEVARLTNSSQRLLARERCLWNALECASNVILSVDKQGAIRYVNSAAEQVQGIPLQSLLRQGVSSLLSGGGTDLLLLLQRRQRSDRSRDCLPLESTARHASSATAHVEISLGEMPDVDGSTGFTFVRRDVTGGRRAEQLARERLAELEHLQRVHTVDVLATNLAHELYQPLVAVCLQADFATTQVREGMPTPELGEALQEIVEHAQRASHVISSPRRMASKSEDHRTGVGVNVPVRNALGLCDAAARDRGLKLTYRPLHPSAEVEVSNVQLEQVLLNLIQNAMESIESEGSQCGELSIHERRQGSEHVELIVADNDRGFREDPERLFQCFFSTRTSGRGLGLAICRKIIEDHQGKISARSLPGAGVEFRITLPVVRVKESVRV